MKRYTIFLCMFCGLILCKFAQTESSDATRLQDAYNKLKTNKNQDNQKCFF